MKKFINFFITLILFSFIFTNNLTFKFYDIPSQTKNIHNIKNFRKLIEIPPINVISNSKHRSCLEMCFGNPPVCRKLVIHGQSFYIWLTEINNNQDIGINQKFDPRLSSTIYLNRVQLILDYEESKNIIGYSGIDDIYIEDKKIFRGNFFLATESKSYAGFDGMIGLGYNPASYEEGYSFIDQLYNNKIIYHKVFTQSFLSSDSGEISFGAIPQYIVMDYKNYGRCNALNKIKNGEEYKNRKWQCGISGFFYGKEKDKISSLDNIRVSFFSYRKRALVPETFFNELEKNYFSLDIFKNKCERKKIKRYDLFTCKEKINNAPEINFVFNNWVMVIPSRNLFNEVSKGNFEFILHHKTNKEHFSLGRPIVRNFHMVYDVQNKEIGFYSKENVIYLGEDEPTVPLIYEDISDDPQENVKKEEEREKVKPEDILNPEKKEDYIDNDEIPEIKSRSVKIASVIQLLFKIFIGVIIVIFIVFGVIIYMKYRKKTHFYNHEFYKKQSEKLEETNLTLENE